MPQVINGIGTWYWGKKNLHGVNSVCESCGRSGELLSYDTRSYVVVFFVPIIPLGRKRVLEECPACRKHRVVKYKDWRQLKDVDLPAAIDAFRASPQDREKCAEAINMCVAAQDVEALDEATRIAAVSLATDAEMQGLLGSAHEYFSSFERAEEAFRASITAQDDPDLRNALSRTLLHLERPDDAWEMIAHDLNESPNMRGGLALLIAESYQTWGMHDAAQTVLDQTIDVLPHLATDKDYKKLRKSATKYQGTDKKLKPKLLKVPKSKAKKGKSIGRYVKLGFLAIVLGVGVMTFSIASLERQKSRKVHVVNGLDVPYRVSIAGTTIKLHPKGRKVLKLAEGDISVSPNKYDISIPDETVNIQSGFFTRLFDDDVYVINPDRTALLFWEKVEYSVRVVDDVDYEYAYHCGKLLHRISDVDYPFESLPRTISTDSSGAVYKSRLEFLRDWTVATTGGVLQSEVNEQAALDFLARYAEYGSDSETTLGLAGALLPREQLLALIERLRQLRPVRVEAHRIYQYMAYQTQDADDIIAEYRSFLADEPTDASRAYLLGRVAANPDESEQLMKQSVRGDPPCPRAYISLAYKRLGTGRFEEALEIIEKGRALAPKHSYMQYQYVECLAANGRLDEALKEVQNVHSTLLAFTNDQLYYYCLSEDRSLLDRYVKRVLGEQADPSDSGFAERFKAISKFMTAYVDGDVERAIEASKSVDDSVTTLAHAIMSDDLSAAGNVLDTDPSMESIHALLLSLLLADKGDEVGARHYEDVARTKMHDSGFDERRMAGWLAGDSLPTEDEVIRCALDCELKSVALVAMARKLPESSERFLELANKISFDRRFPHLTITELIEKGTAVKAPTTPN